jgi:hypothetical protein
MKISNIQDLASEEERRGGQARASDSFRPIFKLRSKIYLWDIIYIIVTSLRSYLQIQFRPRGCGSVSPSLIEGLTS